MSYGSTTIRRWYDHAPAWIKGVVASAYSVKTMRTRFGVDYRRHRVALERSQWWSLEEVLAYAHGEAERYRDWLIATTPACAALAARTPWRELPLLTKETLRGDSLRFRSAAPEVQRATLLRHTSGTTGTPLEFPVTRDAYQREYAFAWQHRAWHDCPRGVRTATIAGHPVVSTAQTSPPFWIRNLPEKQLLFSSYHMSPVNLPHYARALARFAPALIHGYPSSVALVAAAVIDAGAQVRPRAVITASETLLPHQRETIRNAFGVEPRVWYGNTELAGNIVECPAGRLHNREDHSFVELLDGRGEPAAAGSPARLVVTAYGNRAFGLLRYDTEDLVVPSAEAGCPCGRAGRLIERITGRIEDFVIDAAGNLLGRLDHLFKDAHGVREAQLVQREPGEVIVRIVPVGAPTPALEQPIRAEATLRFAPGTRLRFEYVERLEKTAAGKTRFVVSHVRSAAGSFARLAGDAEGS